MDSIHFSVALSICDSVETNAAAAVFSTFSLV
jgi:hypothetical protein